MPLLFFFGFDSSSFFISLQESSNNEKENKSKIYRIAGTFTEDNN